MRAAPMLIGVFTAAMDQLFAAHGAAVRARLGDILKGDERRAALNVTAAGESRKRRSSQEAAGSYVRGNYG